VKRARGFTLIEVLVALAIVTVGMAALLSALSSSADAATFLRDKTFAEWVALNRIEEVRLGAQMPQKGKSDGDAELAGRKWKWKQEVLETEVPGILRIDVSVKPAEVAGDSNWYTTVSGIRGNALASPSGLIDFYGRPPAGGPGGPGGPGGNPRGGSNNNVGGGNNTGPNNGGSGTPNPPSEPTD
jgi:general secretion pathway protein I